MGDSDHDSTHSEQTALPRSGDASDGYDAAGLFDSDDFKMFAYKILPCAKRHVHDWTHCPYAHPGEKARRRDPRTHSYLAVPCPEVKQNQPCPRGDSCQYCHSVFEYWLHPSRYRTQLCQNGTNCKRTICFFAHQVSELRVPDHSHLTAKAKQQDKGKDKEGRRSSSQDDGAGSGRSRKHAAVQQQQWAASAAAAPSPGRRTSPGAPPVAAQQQQQADLPGMAAGAQQQGTATDAFAAYSQALRVAAAARQLPSVAAGEAMAAAAANNPSLMQAAAMLVLQRKLAVANAAQKASAAAAAAVDAAAMAVAMAHGAAGPHSSVDMAGSTCSLPELTPPLSPTASATSSASSMLYASLGAGFGPLSYAGGSAAAASAHFPSSWLLGAQQARVPPQPQQQPHLLAQLQQSGSLLGSAGLAGLGADALATLGGALGSSSLSAGSGHHPRTARLSMDASVSSCTSYDTAFAGRASLDMSIASRPSFDYVARAVPLDTPMPGRPSAAEAQPTYRPSLDVGSTGRASFDSQLTCLPGFDVPFAGRPSFDTQFAARHNYECGQATSAGAPAGMCLQDLSQLMSAIGYDTMGAIGTLAQLQQA